MLLVSIPAHNFAQPLYWYYWLNEIQGRIRGVTFSVLMSHMYENAIKSAFIYKNMLIYL
jgi:hypothetical protein